MTMGTPILYGENQILQCAALAANGSIFWLQLLKKSTLNYNAKDFILTNMDLDQKQVTIKHARTYSIIINILIYKQANFKHSSALHRKLKENPYYIFNKLQMILP